MAFASPPDCVTVASLKKIKIAEKLQRFQIAKTKSQDLLQKSQKNREKIAEEIADKSLRFFGVRKKSQRFCVFNFKSQRFRDAKRAALPSPLHLQQKSIQVIACCLMSCQACRLCKLKRWRANAKLESKHKQPKGTSTLV